MLCTQVQAKRPTLRQKGAPGIASPHGQSVRLLTVQLSGVLATECSTPYQHLQGAFELSELSPEYSTNTAHVVQILSFHD